MGKLVAVMVLALAACGGGSDVVGQAAPAGAFPAQGKWAVTGAVSGQLELAVASYEMGTGKIAAWVYGGTLNGAQVSGRQGFVNDYFDPSFTLSINGQAATATMTDRSHFSAVLGGSALDAVRLQ